MWMADAISNMMTCCLDDCGSSRISVHLTFLESTPKTTRNQNELSPWLLVCDNIKQRRTKRALTFMKHYAQGTIPTDGISQKCRTKQSIICALAVHSGPARQVVLQQHQSPHPGMWVWHDTWWMVRLRAHEACLALSSFKHGETAALLNCFFQIVLHKILSIGLPFFKCPPWTLE